jgi:hypothetical protein
MKAPIVGHKGYVALKGVLSTYDRKPPLSSGCRRSVEILSHSAEVEVIPPKRVDMLAHERSDVAQRFLLNLVSFGAQIGDDRGDMNHVPGHYGIVQN